MARHAAGRAYPEAAETVVGHPPRGDAERHYQVLGCDSWLNRPSFTAMTSFLARSLRIKKN
jgi:hypothetical protein